MDSSDMPTLTPREIASRLRMSEGFIVSEIQRGNLEAYDFGNPNKHKYRASENQYQQWIQRALITQDTEPCQSDLITLAKQVISSDTRPSCKTKAEVSKGLNAIFQSAKQAPRNKRKPTPKNGKPQSTPTHNVGSWEVEDDAYSGRH